MKTQQVKQPTILKVKELGQCIGCYSCMLACGSIVHKNFSLTKSAISIKTSGGYQGRMVVNICRGCVEPSCASQCDFGALTPRTGGGVQFHSDQCTGCKKCINACLAKAIKFDQEEKKIIVCIQCGSCVKVCPHNVLEMEVSSYGEESQNHGDGFN